MQHCEPGHSAGQRHVQPPQSIGLTSGDPAGLGQHDVIKLKALGQGDRHDREPEPAFRRFAAEHAFRWLGAEHAERELRREQRRADLADPGSSRARAQAEASRLPNEPAGTDSTASAPASVRSDRAGRSPGAIEGSRREA